MLFRLKNNFSETIFCVFVFLLSFNINAQNTFPKNYFQSPLAIPLKLAGDFGEIRPNHFHTGIDIRTEEKTGLNVYAVADGYVSRINVSTWGYGNALYITHPNGFVSVYGHLSAYNNTITKYLRKEQYRLEKYAVDLELKPTDIPVKKGEIVAFSGNTGDAVGPHLHFEIRDEKTEHPYNPLLFGFNVKDNIAPKINDIAVYPLDRSSSVNNENTVDRFRVTTIGDKHFLKKNDSIVVHGNIGFAIDTYDMMNYSGSVDGVYSIELQLDGKRIYFSEMQELDFSKSRYVNTFIDYPEFLKTRKAYQKSFLSKNNSLPIYKDVVNRGIINFTDNNKHELKYIVKDFSGNTSELQFTVQSESRKKIFLSEPDKAYFDCDKNNTYQTDDFNISIPAYSLFDDLGFTYQTEEPKTDRELAPLCTIENKYVPLSGSYTLAIKPSKEIKSDLQSKAIVVLLNGKYASYEGGEWSNGYLKTDVKTFGTFTIMLDTIPPVIKPFNIYSGKNMSKLKSIELQMHDNLSGIKSYRGTIDGKWVLMQYNPKRDMLYFDFDDSITSGKHVFKIVLTDNADNSSSYEAEFTR
ncbi:MAG TPA: M23 family metallopeptidase [Bacteroidia bacterium]|nr:M23 family metallopeptidase [Bacteroidia bacterium]